MKYHTYLIRSLSDILSLDTIKLALLTAIPLLALWGVGVWLLWDEMLSIARQIISWLPFSIVRANGAFLIVFFIWFIATLVSYALFIGLFSGFLLGGKKERRFEAINFAIILFFALLWAVVLMFNWESVDAQIKHLLTILPFDTVADTLANLLAFYLFYNLFLISEYFVVFTFRQPFLEAIALRYGYALSEKSTPGASVALIKDIALFALLSLLILPLLFIPITNFLAMWFVWAWLYKESAFIGVCTFACEEKDKELLQERRSYFLLASLSAALLNFIPILSIFTPFFIFTLYLHWIMEAKNEKA